MRHAYEKFPILPMLNNSEQIITDSLKNIVETRIICLRNMFSDNGEYDGRRILSVRWVQDGVNPTWPP